MQSILEPEHRIELLIRKEAPQKDFVMRTADAIDSPVTLHESHRVPRKVVVDDMSRLLEIHAFGQNIGRHENIEEAITLVSRRLRGSRSEAEESFLLPPGRLPSP